MSKLTNVTMSVNDVDLVRQLACELLAEINAIQFVLTEQEQRGLYSIIRNLEFATWEFDQEPGEPRFTDRQLDDIQSDRLKKLLEKAKNRSITPESREYLKQTLAVIRKMGDQNVD
jgi:6-phosphogluconolactonase (cycloisomerase 2 family)